MGSLNADRHGSIRHKWGRGLGGEWSDVESVDVRGAKDAKPRRFPPSQLTMESGKPLEPAINGFQCFPSVT